MKIVAVLLVAITACAAEQNHNDVTQHLGWFRLAHGGKTIPSDDQLVAKAKKATQEICQRGFAHHPKTESYDAALNWVSFSPCPDGSNGKNTLIETLKKFYRECPDYRGAEFHTNDNGHFTIIVWKGSTKYGMWSQTCDMKNGNCDAGGCCVAAYKSDGLFNLPGDFNSNIDNIGACVNAETPWFDVCRRIDC